MRKRWRWGLALLCLAAAAGPAAAAQWVQYTADGKAEARLVTSAAACPAITIDGRTQPMRERAAPDARFPVRSCALKLPDATRAVAIGKQPLAVPRPPTRIVILGDTGCRLHAGAFQDCNDPARWPFARIAALAAGMRPDLVIHVGDYYYREAPCPASQAKCAGSPAGDMWASWDADLFTPAAPLLAAAPWILTRGNHEDCGRGWRGWTRFLAPGAFAANAPCEDHEPSYAVAAQGLTFIVLDDADAADLPVASAKVPSYREEFARIASLAAGPSWLIYHRPLRAALSVFGGLVVGGNQTLLAALREAPALPPSVELLVSGHIHAFEAINYREGSPPQLVVGTGGDKLEPAPDDLAGLDIGGLLISEGTAWNGFGFFLMIREGEAWRGELYDAGGEIRHRCTFAQRRFACDRPN